MKHNFLSESTRTIINPYVRQRAVGCCHISPRIASEIAAWSDSKSIAVEHHLTRLANVNNLQDGGQNTVKTSHNLDYTRKISTDCCTGKYASCCFVRAHTNIPHIDEIFCCQNAINTTIHNFLQTFLKRSLAPSIANPFWLVGNWARDLHATNYNVDKSYSGR